MTDQLTPVQALTADGILATNQRPLTGQQAAEVSGALTRYRIMAFVTGVVLFAGTVALILKYTTSWDLEPFTGYLWLGHGYLYLVYVIVTAILGVRLRWPLARYALVMLAGTIPTMSFVAEYFVTRATRTATNDQAVDVRD